MIVKMFEIYTHIEQIFPFFPFFFVIFVINYMKTHTNMLYVFKIGNILHSAISFWTFNITISRSHYEKYDRKTDSQRPFEYRTGIGRFGHYIF